MTLASKIATRERFLLVAAATAIAYLALTVFESRAFGWYPVREEPAEFSAYHLARIGFSALAAWLIVATLASGLRESTRGKMIPAGRLAAMIIMALAYLCIALFLADPALFRALSLEDGPVENLSALALLLGSGVFAVRFMLEVGQRGSLGDRLGQLAMLGLAGILFVIAMEEISWGQRLFGYATPGAVAELNWQGEFNLHNIQTDLSETLYYTGGALFLILAPLIAEAIPDWGPLEFLRRFAPGRSVAAAAAPIAIFNYGHWNLIPIQLTAMLTPLVLIAFARAASRDGDRAQTKLLVALAAAVVIGQALFLALGPRMLQIYDATEYKELFLALGFGWYAIDWALRARRETVYLAR